MSRVNVNYDVYFEFPEGHEYYNLYGDSESCKNEIEALDLADELKEEGASFIKITVTEDYGGMVADQQVIYEWGEPQ